MTKAESPSYQNLSRLHSEHKASLTDGDGAHLVKEYLGGFDEESVHRISAEVEETLMAAEMPKSIIKRTFAILIEALQNTRLHGTTDVSGAKLISLLVVDTPAQLIIHFMNLTIEEQAAEVERRVSMLNVLDAKELKAYYMEVMTNGERSSKGGAGLGLITMVMKSKNPVDITHECESSDRCVLKTTIHLDKPVA